MKMFPLNPNGKVDKPKLPFPDIAVLNRRRASSVVTDLSQAERTLAQIWARLVPGVFVKTLKPTDSFFEIGGNSMHGQQLPFNIRRQWRGVDIKISEIYDNPTLGDMAAFIERRESENENGIENAATNNGVVNDTKRTRIEYGEDAVALKRQLAPQFRPGKLDSSTSSIVFLTGATGYLGAYVLKDLFQRTNPKVNVVTLVRAKNEEAAASRIRSTCEAYGFWSDSWATRLQCVPGSLDVPHFGMPDQAWQKLAEEVDVVIHNGAQVHWINPYPVLKPSNVMGTIEALNLCSIGKPKQFAFVSSTSVLDNDHYVFESERAVAAGGEGISEDDDLEGSRMGLGTGYGQSKWVAEYLVREAGNRGLQGCIIRPGYVTGDSRSGGKRSTIKPRASC